MVDDKQSKTLISTEDRGPHQRGVARVVFVDWTRSRGVHVAEQTLDLPQRDSASSVRHLKNKGEVC
ncbi:hypothetical protein EYF80_059579 [Liparis tanakae]|uniref:Uncharacterized protein n=1 Tax=Liparis tanakae TaxID=230148 RepID=A0A4Z2ENV5_9TELE|nr:hypothetical protein EYF80_059579 [Liparis tanakae]